MCVAKSPFCQANLTALVVAANVYRGAVGSCAQEPIASQRWSNVATERKLDLGQIRINKNVVERDETFCRVFERHFGIVQPLHSTVVRRHSVGEANLVGLIWLPALLHARIQLPVPIESNEQLPL